MTAKAALDLIEHAVGECVSYRHNITKKMLIPLADIQHALGTARARYDAAPPKPGDPLPQQVEVVLHHDGNDSVGGKNYFQTSTGMGAEVWLDDDDWEALDFVSTIKITVVKGVR